MHLFLAHSIKKGLEEMGDSARAETEQALYNCMRKLEKERDRPAYHSLPPPEPLGYERGIKIPCKSVYSAISTPHSLNKEPKREIKPKTDKSSKRN